MGNWDQGQGWSRGPQRGWPLASDAPAQTFKVTLVGLTEVVGGGVIRSPGRTDWDTGDGFWLGVDSDNKAKFGVGDASGNQLTWDGTTLDITGTITADAGEISGELTITSPSGIIIAGSGDLDDDLTGIAFNYELITAQDNGVTQWTMNENGIIINIGTGVTTNDLLFYNGTEAADAGRLQLQYDGDTNDHQLDLLCYGYDFDTTTTLRIAALGAGSDLADLFLTDGTIYTTTADVGIGTNAPLSPLHLGLATEDLEFVDAGSTGATEQDWIEVEVGGNQGYIRVYATK